MLHPRMVRRQAGPVPSVHPFEKRVTAATLNRELLARMAAWS
jgi:hypothetical protein